MKQRLPLARTDLVWCCPERPVNHYVLPFSHVILDLVLVRYERRADVGLRFAESLPRMGYPESLKEYNYGYHTLSSF